jgi:tetratricopeptide (TPR) repeat protein
MACTTPPQNADEAVREGVALLATDVDAATSKFQAAIELVPEHRGAYAHLARIHFDAERWRPARHAARRALVDVDPEEVDVELVEIVARASVAIEDWEEAASTLSRLLELDPSRTELIAEVARAHLERGSTSDAIEAYVVAVERRPDDVDARTMLVDLMLDRLEQSLDAWTRERGLVPWPGDAEDEPADWTYVAFEPHDRRRVERLTEDARVHVEALDDAERVARLAGLIDRAAAPPER